MTAGGVRPIGAAAGDGRGDGVLGAARALRPGRAGGRRAVRPASTAALHHGPARPPPPPPPPPPPSVISVKYSAPSAGQRPRPGDRRAVSLPATEAAWRPSVQPPAEAADLWTVGKLQSHVETDNLFADTRRSCPS